MRTSRESAILGGALSGRAGVIQYVLDLTCPHFLRIIDEQEEIKTNNYDLKAVNPNRKDLQNSRAPEELIAIIESQIIEILKALEVLKNNHL